MLQAQNFTGRAVHPYFSFLSWSSWVPQPELGPSCISCGAEGECLHQSSSSVNKWDAKESWEQKHFQVKVWIQAVTGEVGFVLQGSSLAAAGWNALQGPGMKPNFQACSPVVAWRLAEVAGQCHNFWGFPEVILKAVSFLNIFSPRLKKYIHYLRVADLL